jgi:hypothetical protein
MLNAAGCLATGRYNASGPGQRKAATPSEGKEAI